MAGEYTQGEPESFRGKAKVCWDAFKAKDYTDSATAGALGSFVMESSFVSGQSQVGGGGGYGLNQWTPRENLYTQGAKLGYSRSECDTLEVQAKICADGAGQWQDTQATGSTSYVPEASVTLSLSTYKKLNDVEKATYEWEAHFGRGAYVTLHMTSRIAYAKAFYKMFQGTGSGDDESGETKTVTENILLTNWLNLN